MAVHVVAFDGTRLSAAESETDGGTWDEWDSGKSPTQETDLVWQFGASNAEISLKVGTGESGVEFEATTAVDFSTTPKVWLAKFWITNFAVLNTIGPTAGVLYLGSGTTTDRYNYYAIGAPGSVERSYPPRGGWQFIPIDPNVSAFRDATDGTPSLTAIDYYALSCTFTTTSKTENVAVSAIDYVDSGKGLTITRGDSTDPDCTFQDVVDEDQGSSANRWGVVVTEGKAIVVRGTITIGESATATEFTDSLRQLFFPDTLADVGFTGIAIDLGNASTVVTIDDCAFISDSRSNLKRWFDTEDEVDATNDEIDHVAHGYVTGQAVLYAKGGGTEAIGLTDATEYFVEAVTADAFALHTTRQGAMTAGTPINLTASTAGNGEQHSFRRQPDGRATFLITGTSGSAPISGCVWESFRLLTLTSGATLTSCKFVSCSRLVAAQGTLDDCVASAPLLAEGEAFLSTPDLADITNCRFTIGDDGHALEITAAGSYAFDGNLFTGYWSHGGDAGAGAEFDTTSGVDAGTDVITTNNTHGLVDGDAVYYNDGGGSATPGLTDGARYYVNQISTTTLSLHVTKQDATSDTNRVALTSAGGETHALYSTKATILNNSGGAVTITIGDGGDGITVRNAGNSDTTTILTGAVTTLLNVKNNLNVNEPGVQVLIEARTGTGPLPVDDTITLTASGAVATAVHTAHGMVNGDKVVVRKAVENAYNGVFSITNVTTNGYDYTMGSSPTSPATGTIKATGVVVAGLTDASGNISASRSFSTSQTVKGVARKASASPRYKDFQFLDTVDNLAGLTKSIQLILDQS